MNNAKYRIALVVLTYNRKDLLIRCLRAVLNQTIPPQVVYIIDHASTDGTATLLREEGFMQVTIDKIDFRYIRLDVNEGPSNGFYHGIKYAFEDDYYDAIWVMDDDGIPENDCLENLIPYLSEYDYLAPIVLSTDDHRSCSFAPHHEDINTFASLKNAQNGLIKDWASPYNGVLYSHKLIETIGYPKKEMYMWGDEYNYHIRAIHNGFTPYTILSATHYHPLNRVQCVRSFGTKISVTEVEWKLYCCIRNYTYNSLRYLKFPNNLWYCLRMYIAYLYYGGLKKILMVTDAFICGLIGRFSRLDLYKNSRRDIITK